jgi:hypothetical protein
MVKLINKKKICIQKTIFILLKSCVKVCQKKSCAKKNTFKKLFKKNSLLDYVIKHLITQISKKIIFTYLINILGELVNIFLLYEYFCKIT